MLAIGIINVGFADLNKGESGGTYAVTAKAHMNVDGNFLFDPFGLGYQHDTLWKNTYSNPTVITVVDPPSPYTYTYLSKIKKGSSVPLSVKTRNNAWGGEAKFCYFSMSMSNGLTYDSSKTGVDNYGGASISFSDYPPNSDIGHKDGRTIKSTYELLDVEIKPANTAQEQNFHVGIKTTAQAEIGKEEWIRYRYTCSTPATISKKVNYPTSSSYTDQQGWKVNKRTVSVYECDSDSHCPSDQWIGNNFCQDSDVYQKWRDHYCSSNTCTYSDSNGFKQDCGDDSCGGWSSDYCYNNDIYHSRTCHNKGCSNNACFDNQYGDSEKAQECGTKDCDTNNHYFIDGTNSATTTSYCKHRDYQDCNRPCYSDACQDCSCNTYSDSTQNTAGICKYIDGCSGSTSGTVKNYTKETSCGAGKECDGNGNCFYVNRWDLSKGWNLLSFPLKPINTSIKSIFQNINFSSILSYGSWYYYFNETHNNFNKINQTKGYWINSLNNQTLQIEGIEFNYPINFSLKKGWNLISYPSLNEKLINESLKNINFTSIKTNKNNRWYTYHKNRNNSLNTLKNLTPGYAYWITLPNNTNIKFNGTHFN